VIDEFAAFAMPLFIDLLDKTRSAGMAITIAHQSMRSDLARAGEGYAGQVADNTNIKICLQPLRRRPDRQRWHLGHRPLVPRIRGPRPKAAR
jgi:TraM recognition site of TraD and TraG